MSKPIKAVNAYRPRIEQGNTVQKAEFIRAVSRATTLLEGTVNNALTEFRDQIITFCRTGRAVKLDGLGIFTPGIDTEGKLAINFRADGALNFGMNQPGTFTGTILNREHIGLTLEQFVQIWNDEHPEELITFSEN
jgi:nucleoid DNA-binding protein